MMQLVRALDTQFARLHERSAALVRAVPPDRLYWQPPAERPRFFPVYSVGEHVLRGAAAVEQTCGGVISNLWDDPFEWTLPEALAAPEQVVDLEEAEATRLRAFALFSADADLSKEIAAPSGGMRSLFDLLTDTLVRASHHQGRAYATFRLFSDARLPPV
jgi:hypothetical protein